MPESSELLTEARRLLEWCTTTSVETYSTQHEISNWIRKYDTHSQRDELREKLLALRIEVNCRIEHGAESGGHLEYAQKQLDAMLKGD